MVIAQQRESCTGAFLGFATRATRRYLFAFLLLLAGYAIFGKGFAYLGYPPVFIGDVMLVVGCVVALGNSRGPLLAAVCSLPGVALVFLMLWGLACALPYLGQYGLFVVRDGMLLGYGLYAFIIAAFLTRDPSLLRDLILCYRAFTPYLVMLLPFVIVVTLTVGDSLVWPITGVPLFAMKFGDVAVQLAGVASLSIVGLNRLRPTVLVVLSILILVEATINRGGATAFFISTFVAILLAPRGGGRRQYFLVLAVAALVFGGAALLDVSVKLAISERPLAARQLVSNALSVVSDSSGGDNTEGSKLWRLQWWDEIINYTFHGRYFWYGKGFGVNLADADGFQVASEGTIPLRSPHSVNMTILARTGVPGLLLWFTALGSWLGVVCHRLILVRRSGDVVWMRFFAFLMCFWLAFLINASFDVALEGPVAGIWFWTVHGVGIAATILHRSECLRPVGAYGNG
jgi:O-Antigen ligase